MILPYSIFLEVNSLSFFRNNSFYNTIACQIFYGNRCYAIDRKRG